MASKAPPEIRVIRNEIANSENVEKSTSLNSLPPDAVHAVRNRLNKAVLGIHLLQRKIQRGESETSEDTIQNILYELATLANEIEQANRPLDSPTATRRRILLVEDDYNESELLAGFLRTYNFDVKTAKDGDEALDYLADHPNPDFVLLDMRMPGKDGPETIEEIRRDARFHNLKVYAVSGTEPRSLGVPTGPQGIDGWFPKPLDPQVLVKELSTVEASAV